MTRSGVAAALGLLAALAARPVAAFELDGHETIEAASPPLSFRSTEYDVPRNSVPGL